MKVGITTHYYNSNNYGGNLQAYALCQVLQKNGVQAEQICYSALTKKRTPFQILKEKGLVAFCKLVAKRVLGVFKKIFNKNKKIKGFIAQRKANILAFNQKIPHSDVVYNQDNIVEANDKYDMFITGSDQVWHPSAINKAYTLEFVKNKPKISYAASLSVSELSDNQKEYFKEFIKDYSAVSVREENSV